MSSTINQRVQALGDPLRRAWFWGLIGLAAVMVVWVIFAALGWPGELDTCTLPGGNCYCEAYPPGPVAIKQPSNTWSGLFAALAGLVILFIADRDRLAGPHADDAAPMATGGLYPIMYGALVTFLGPGAMFFHAGLTRFGGWMDNHSMVLYVSFLLLYDASRLLRFDTNRVLFIIIFAAANVIFGTLIWFAQGSGTIIFAILAVVAVLVQVVILIWSPRGLVRRPWPWLVFAVIAFGVGTLVWRLTWTDAPWCDPQSPIQGHFIWHLLAMAATPFLIFFYLRDETRA